MTQTPASHASSASKPTIYLDDLAVGDQFTSGEHAMDEAQITAFAAQFDPQPFHLDDAAARATLFGGLAASGWHTAGIVMRMMCDGFILDSSSLGSPGLDSLKWHKPVLVGDALRARMTVLDSRPMKSKPHVGLVQTRWEALNQRDEIVMTIESWAMFGRRTPGAAVTG